MNSLSNSSIEMSGQNHFQLLPNEIKKVILEELVEIPDIAKASRVCKEWKGLLKDRPVALLRERAISLLFRVFLHFAPAE